MSLATYQTHLVKHTRTMTILPNYLMSLAKIYQTPILAQCSADGGARSSSVASIGYGEGGRLKPANGKKAANLRD